MIIYFTDKITTYCFIKLWINQKNKIKLYKLCTTNSVIKTKMWYLSKYYNIIDERKYIRTLKSTCFHVMSVSYEWINNKMRNCILSEYQFYEKRLLSMLFICYWIRKRNSLSSYTIIYWVDQKQKSYYFFIWNMLYDFCIRN